MIKSDYLCNTIEVLYSPTVEEKGFRSLYRIYPPRVRLWVTSPTYFDGLRHHYQNVF